MLAPLRYEVEGTVPILRVADLRRSLRFYREVLGFEVQWGGEPGSGMAGVSRGPGALMLCEGAQGQPGTWVWIGVDDAGALHAALAGRGVRIREGPRNYPWAHEFRVEDPDGHVLRFGSEPRADLPVEAPGG